MLGQKDVGPREILWCVNCYSVVRDGEHPYGVAVFDEAKQLHSLGAFQRPLLELPEAAPPRGHGVGIRMRFVAAAKPGGADVAGAANGILERAGQAWQMDLPTLFEGPIGPDDPGMAVATYRDGALVDVGCAGLASVEFGVPIDARTRFDIALASKQFTAVSVLLLARDGVLALADDIRDHLPELNVDQKITIEQCLHTADLQEWFALVGIAGVPVTRRTEGHFLSILAGIRRTNFAPGVEFSYSNTGYVLAAAIIRRATGMSLREFSAERIFGPLGMADTMWRDDSSEVLPRFAYGYGNDVMRRADTEECVVGDGGLATTVADLARWLGFLADGRVLGADIRAALLERMVLADGTVHPYALGVYHFTVGGKAVYGHAGSVDGYRSQLLYAPEDGLGFACLANQTRIDPLTRRVLAAVGPGHVRVQAPPRCEVLRRYPGHGRRRRVLAAPPSGPEGRLAGRQLRAGGQDRHRDGPRRGHRRAEGADRDIPVDGHAGLAGRAGEAGQGPPQGPRQSAGRHARQRTVQGAELLARRRHRPGPQPALPGSETSAQQDRCQGDRRRRVAPPGRWVARRGRHHRRAEHGFTPRAGRNSARLALAADLPASVLADFTGTNISNATRWTGYARRDWFDYIASRTQI
ncbi:serine hydrolase [Streptomyces atratus]|nr:serine hydrolase domain-containing protein [Streptomyces atratus]WPW26465.1 serine hydrolase [Streptomyces atratus]GGT73690.1 hypothetical protein GCM10010207_84140 [Streptomyces atratus]